MVLGADLIVIGTSAFLVNGRFGRTGRQHIPLYHMGTLLVVGFFVRWCRYGRRRDAISASVLYSRGVIARRGNSFFYCSCPLVILRDLVVDRPAWKNLPGAIWRDRWNWVPFFALGAVFRAGCSL